MTPAEWIALGSMAVAALSVILTGLTIVLSHRNAASERAHADTIRREQWAHEDAARRDERAHEAVRASLAVLNQVEQMVDAPHDELNQSMLRPSRNMLNAAVVGLPNPHRGRLISLMDLAFYWENMKARRTEWTTREDILRYLVTSGREMLNSFVTGEQMPEEPPWVVEAREVSAAVSAEIHAELEAAMIRGEE